MAGRKPKDLSERLSAQTWYYFVKSRENLSDQKLSEKFVTGVGVVPRTGPDHIRIFGRIKNYGVMPSANHHRRKYILLPNIYADPLYKGAQEIADSPFWKVIGNKKLNLDEVRHIVVTCLGNLSVVNKPYDGSPSARTYLENIQRNTPPDMHADELIELIRDGDGDYDVALGSVLLPVPIHLDAVALLGALSLEARLANKIMIAKRHKETFLHYLDEYCRQPWIEPISRDLFKLGKSRIETALKINKSVTSRSYRNLLKPLKISSGPTQVEYFLNIHSRLLWSS